MPPGVEPERADLPRPDSVEPPAAPETGDLFDATQTFATLGLRSSVLKGVEAVGFQRPTMIQSKLIPPMLAGRDIMGQARTGSGKTAAFALPILCRVERDKPFQALILAPTRELAIQITAEIAEFAQFTPIKAAAVYGGQEIRVQGNQLKRSPEIIVGTPGRLMDMIQRGAMHLKNARYIVLDEVDRMLDIGFRDDIRRILDMCPPKEQRQTVMVSATISGEIEKLARTHLKDPEKIVVTSGSLTVSQVKQFHLPVNPWDKKRLLLHLLRHEEPALTLVFCNLKRVVDEIATGLTKRGIDAHAIHGDMPQGKRNKTIKQLREGELSVLVASDLASRGLDVDGISHVINFDLPDDPEVYVHRIGRTARAGREGVAWSFVTPARGYLLTEIEMLINKEIPKLEYPDFAPSEAPAGYRHEDGTPKLALTRGAAPPEDEQAPPKPSRLGGVAKATEPGESGEAAGLSIKPDARKFPGGKVPTKLPPKRMMGRVPTHRTWKAAQAEQKKEEPPAAGV